MDYWKNRKQGEGASDESEGQLDESGAFMSGQQGSNAGESQKVEQGQDESNHDGVALRLFSCEKGCPGIVAWPVLRLT